MSTSWRICIEYGLACWKIFIFMYNVYIMHNATVWKASILITISSLMSDNAICSDLSLCIKCVGMYNVHYLWPFKAERQSVSFICECVHFVNTWTKNSDLRAQQIVNRVDQVHSRGGEYHNKAGGGEEGVGRRVERTVRTLVGAAHLADAQDVQRGCVECSNEKLFGPQRLDDDRLSGSSEIGDRKVSEKKG